MKQLAVTPLIRADARERRTDHDLVAVEAPLAIEVIAGGAAHPLGVFLRTPGDDIALGMGLLVAEGVITSQSDVVSSTLDVDEDGASARLRLALAPHVAFDAAALARSGVASTACGLCGRIRTEFGVRGPASGARTPDARPRTPDAGPRTPNVSALPHRLRAAQTLFAETGGLHAAAFFDVDGALVDIAEDVGRHNAVDKLVGRALQAERLPAADVTLVLSGRVAFEIIQKAAAAGVRVVVAVGAPTSLAVQAARAANMTLIGFVRDERCNIYAERT